jgi:hypothetical protein
MGHYDPRFGAGFFIGSLHFVAPLLHFVAFRCGPKIVGFRWVFGR